MKCGKLVAWAITILVSANSLAAAGEEAVGDLSIDTVTQAGVQIACAINFKAVGQDFVSMRGAPVGVTGSLYWSVSTKGAGLLLKVLGFDMTVGETQPPKAFAIPHAFITINDTPFLPEKKISCDSPAGYCGMFGFSKAFDAFKLVGAGGELAVVKYNRTADGMDSGVRLPQLNADQNLKLTTCMSTLVEQVIPQLAK